jgi:hypothetical protein
VNRLRALFNFLLGVQEETREQDEEEVVIAGVFVQGQRSRVHSSASIPVSAETAVKPLLSILD